MQVEELNKLEKHFEEIFLSLPDKEFLSYLDKGKVALVKCLDIYNMVYDQKHKLQMQALSDRKDNEITSLKETLRATKVSLRNAREQARKAAPVYRTANWSEDEFDKIANKFYGWYEMSATYKQGIKEALGVIDVKH